MNTFLYRTSISFLFLLFTHLAWSQKSNDFNIKSNTNIVLGEDEEYSYQVMILGYEENTAEELTYAKIPTDGGNVELFEKGKLKIDGLTFKRYNGVIRNNRLFEYYLAFKAGLAITKKEVYIVERSLKDFEIVGKPVLVAETKMVSKMFFTSDFLYADESGFYVAGIDSRGKSDIIFLKRYDFSLKLLWTKDVSFLNTKDYTKPSKVRFNENEKAILFEIDLAKCEDCGAFKKKQAVSRTTLAIVGYTADGEEFKFIPSLPDGTVYGKVDFYYSHTNKSVSGIFQIHEFGKNEYEQSSGLGYLFCEWDITSGDLKVEKTKRFTFQDILGDEKKLLSQIDPKGKIDINSMFPRVKVEFETKKLANNDFLIVISSLQGVDKDKYLNKDFNKNLGNSTYLVCLSIGGDEKWSRFIPVTDGTFHYGEVTTNMNYNFLLYGNKENYPGDNYSFSKVVPERNVFCYGQINLKTGEIVFRKSFEETQKNVFVYGSQDFIESKNIFLVTISKAGLGEVKANVRALEMN